MALRITTLRKVVVIHRGNQGDHRIASPAMQQAEAEADLQKIRDGRERAEAASGSAHLTDLPWLCVDARYVLSAHLSDADE